jgi:membrane protein implicated in regulation of membrane protease activity
MMFTFNALMVLAAFSIGIAAFSASSGLTAWIVRRVRREKEAPWATRA